MERSGCIPHYDLASGWECCSLRVFKWAPCRGFACSRKFSSSWIPVLFLVASPRDGGVFGVIGVVTRHASCVGESMNVWAPVG